MWSLNLFIFFRSILRSTPETNHINVKCVPNNSTTRLTCAVTCAYTRARNLSPARSAAKVSSVRTAWSSTQTRTGKRRPEQQRPPPIPAWQRCSWVRRKVLLLAPPSMPAVVSPPVLLQLLCDSSINMSRRLWPQVSGTIRTTKASCSKICWQQPARKDSCLNRLSPTGKAATALSSWLLKFVADWLLMAAACWQLFMDTWLLKHPLDFRI